MKKKFLKFIICLVLALCLPLEVSASPKMMADGEVFDPEFFVSTYSGDLSSITTDEQLYEKYKGSGMLYGYESAALKIGKYSDAAYFMDNISQADAWSYSLKQWKYALKATFFSGLQGDLSDDSISKAYMQDEYKTRELLADVVNGICNTSAKSYSSERESAKTISNIVDVSSMIEKNAIYSSLLNEEKMTAKEVLSDEKWEEMFSTVGKSYYDEQYKSLNDNVSLLMNTAKNLYEINSDFYTMVTDYEKNIRVLNSLEKTASDRTLRMTIYNLKESYTHAYQEAISDIFAKSLKEYSSIAKAKGWESLNIGDSSVSYVDLLNLALEDNDKLVSLGDVISKATIGKGFKTGTALIDIILNVSGESKKASNIDKVIMSTYLRSDAINALRDAENKYIHNINDTEAFNDFYNTFLVAREFTIIQYKNMLDYYDSVGNKEKAEKMSEKMNELSAITPMSYSINLFESIEENKNAVLEEESAHANKESDSSRRGLNQEIEVSSSSELSGYLGLQLEDIIGLFPNGTLKNQWATYPGDTEYNIENVMFLSKNGKIIAIKIYGYSCNYSVLGLNPTHTVDQVTSIMNNAGWSYVGVDNLWQEGEDEPQDLYVFTKGDCSIEYEDRYNPDTHQTTFTSIVYYYTF